MATMLSESIIGKVKEYPNFAHASDTSAHYFLQESLSRRQQLFLKSVTRGL